jgi:hypothetical protein
VFLFFDLITYLILLIVFASFSGVSTELDDGNDFASNVFIKTRSPSTCHDQIILINSIHT